MEESFVAVFLLDELGETARVVLDQVLEDAVKLDIVLWPDIVEEVD